MRTVFILILSTLLLGACDNPFGGHDDPSMSGAWVSDAGDVQFTASQRGDEFEGSGTILYAVGAERPMEVHGVNQYPHLSFTVVDANGAGLNFSGEWDGPNAFSGTMSGYGNGSFAKTFRRR